MCTGQDSSICPLLVMSSFAQRARLLFAHLHKHLESTFYSARQGWKYPITLILEQSRESREAQQAVQHNSAGRATNTGRPLHNITRLQLQLHVETLS